MAREKASRLIILATAAACAGVFPIDQAQGGARKADGVLIYYEVREAIDLAFGAAPQSIDLHSGFTFEPIDLNSILGSKYIVMAHPGKVEGLDGWKKVAETLTGAAEKLKPLGLRAGYHNHQLEFVPIEGKRPMEVLAANTGKDVMLQLDLGTCVEVGSDPVAWINANPGRIASIHCKEWAPGAGKGYKVLVGEGVVPWKKIFEAAEKTGGIEYYLVEQEGSAFPAMETAERCLASFRKLHG